MKAVLVVEVPEEMIGEVDYTILNKEDMVNGRTTLKPLPNEVDYLSGLPDKPEHWTPYQFEIAGYDEGWNDCLNEILDVRKIK